MTLNLLKPFTSEKPATEPKTEKCILCNTDTGVPLNLHIDLRNCYFEGIGQLCHKCYKALNN